MPKRVSSKSAKTAPRRARASARVAASSVRFTATLLRPASPSGAGWMFLVLPTGASAKLPSRGQVTVEGTIAGAPLLATLEPDGNGGHWLKVEPALLEAAGAAAGDVVSLELTPVPPDREPEPKLPPDLRKALASAPADAKEAWSDITPAARRDWIAWITSAKQDQTRARRIASASEMLAKGKRRPCCFDRSGMYAKSMSCPVAE